MTALKNDPEQFKRLVTPIGFYLTFMEGESRTKALEMNKKQDPKSKTDL